MASTERSPLSAVSNRDEVREIRAGYVHTAVGICSLISYPIGAIILESKCGWSCFPTVSDVERPLPTGTDVLMLDIFRRALLCFAVFIRVALIPLILAQVFPLLRPPAFKNTAAYISVFYLLLTIWTLSDIFQVAVGNTLAQRADYTPHTIAVHMDVTSLILCNAVLIFSLASDSESRRPWLAIATMALLKVSLAGLFLACRLSSSSTTWQLVEWCMLGAMAGLHTSIGLAMPPTLRLNTGNLKVFRSEVVTDDPTGSFPESILSYLPLPAELKRSN